MLLSLLALGLVVAVLRATAYVSWLACRAAWRHSLHMIRQRPGLVRGLRVAFPEGGLAEIIVSTVVGPIRWTFEKLRSLPSWTTNVRACLAAIAAVTMHGSGWLVMQQMGAFSGLEGLRFWWLSPGQTAQHVADFSPLLFLGAPAFAIVYGTALALLVPRWLAKTTPHKLWWIATSSAVVVAALGAGAWLTFGSSETTRVDPETRISYSEADLFSAAVRYRSSPMTHVLFEMRGMLEPERRGLPTDPNAVVQERELVPLATYVSENQLEHSYNVLFIVVESLRPDQLQEFGGPRPVMPHLDELARESLRFSHAYSSATHSDLADPSILSSQYPARAGGPYPDEIPYPRVLIYDLLAGFGYRTAIISSQNERWGNMIAFLDTGKLDLLLHSETYSGPTYVPRDDSLEEWLKGDKRAGKIDDRFTITEAIKWTGDGSGKPFVAYVNLQNSHIPYTVPADHPRRFSKTTPPSRYSMKSMSDEEVALARDAYADALNYVDAQLGRLFEHLRTTQQWDRTMIIVTGDTGQAFKEHGFVGHSNLPYDEVVRVPIVMKIPGHEPRTDTRLAQHVDLPPTVIDALGLSPHPGFQGHSLIDESPRIREAFITVSNPFNRAIAMVQGKYKLLYDQHLRRLLLFDLEADPGELHDMSQSAASLTDSLKRRLGSWYTAQRSYYFDDARQKREYAPVLEPLPPN